MVAHLVRGDVGIVRYKLDGVRVTWLAQSAKPGGSS